MADTDKGQAQTETAEGISLVGVGIPLANDPGFLAALTPEARELLKAQAEDYSQFVAVQPIYHLGVLAYAAGAPVPATNVKRWQYDQHGLVAKVGTKAATEAVARAAPVSPSTIKAPGD